jgi:DnaK suppressor protein
VNADDLKHFGKRLRDLAAELEEDLAMRDAADSSITPDNAIGRLTRMEAIQAQAMGQEGRRRREKRLQQVRRAIARLAADEYGRCARCAEEIPRGRLEVMPEAGLCVRCSARA